MRGTLEQPEIALTSTPPLEEADILSLIVFNQPINQLGEGAQISLAQRAQGLALGAAAGQLTQSIGSALGVDTFQLNLAPEDGGAASVTIGQQVGQNLFVNVQQGIGDQNADELHPGIRTHEMASSPHQRVAGLVDADRSCSNGSRAAAPTCCSSLAFEILPGDDPVTSRTSRIVLISRQTHEATKPRSSGITNTHLEPVLPA